ncbi:hypothetical protein [Thermus tengchongensis]|uniref:hypothetical protein n=1 Tax=Thermus tengchongensis TaxID=1214928 RepID=UPI001F2108A2|nr:hypothetical protein [Thermus tengchongensis]
MAGFSFSLMAKIERGATDPRSLSALYLTNLARVLGLPLSVLLDEGLPEDIEERRPVALPSTRPSRLPFQEKPPAGPTWPPRTCPGGPWWKNLPSWSSPDPGSSPSPSPSP